MAKNYYAVRKGRVPGIYKTWAECQAQTSGFSGPEFKGFATLAEAEDFMAGGSCVLEVPLDGCEENLPEAYAFTDGSYNIATCVYGFGGFVHYNGEDIPVRGNGADPEVVTSRNVAGEVHGAVAAMEKAIELGIDEITLFYDYEGVEKWPTRVWQAKKPISQFYVERYDELKSSLKVNFVHVKAHTGIPGNEAADRMAKEEAGLL